MQQYPIGSMNRRAASPGRISRGRFSPDGGGRSPLHDAMYGRSQSPYAGSRGTFSRAGMNSRAGSVRDPNAAAADLDNIHINSPDAIERERHYAAVEQTLQEQFNEIDTNKDGNVDMQELHQFMEKMCRDTGAQIDAEVHEKIKKVIDAVFYRMDTDNSQSIQIQEFVKFYFDLYVENSELVEELELRVKDQEQRAQQIEARLVEMRRLEKPSQMTHSVFQEQAIMQGSILSVHIIDARELRPPQGGIANARVRLSIEGNRSSTQEVPGSNNPVWNEVSAFDILQGNENLLIKVDNVKPNREREEIGSTQIDLRQLSAEQQRWMSEHPGKLHQASALETNSILNRLSHSIRSSGEDAARRDSFRDRERRDGRRVRGAARASRDRPNEERRAVRLGAAGKWPNKNRPPVDLLKGKTA